jgi:hypothetical protein
MRNGLVLNRRLLKLEERLNVPTLRQKVAELQTTALRAMSLDDLALLEEYKMMDLAGSAAQASEDHRGSWNRFAEAFGNALVSAGFSIADLDQIVAVG